MVLEDMIVRGLRATEKMTWLDAYELRKGTAVVTVDWPASSAAACGAWLREWLG